MNKLPEELPNLSSLSHEQKDEIIRLLFPLIAEVRRLSARVAELEARLSKDSHNSSKPPSSDGLAKKSQSPNVPSGRKPGAQPGRAGKTLERSVHVDTVINHPLPPHCACGAALAGTGVRLHEQRQVIDIPVASYHVTEHRTWQTRCTCGRVHQSAFPAAVSEVVQYGPNVRALAVHLTHGQLLPLARSAQLISELYGLSISSGTVHAWGHQAAQLLLPEVAGIAQSLTGLPVVHADESGLRVAAHLNWLHTVASPKLTWYGVHAQRGLPAIQDHGILPHRMGTVVHDCWGPYWRVDCAHALCNAHLLRELTFQRETTRQRWPKRLIDILIRSRDYCEAARQAGKTALSAWRIRRIFRDYRAILDRALTRHPRAARHDKRRGRVKQSVAFNLINRMREHAGAVLRFVTDLRVPFTNNLAERAIRMPKVKQKISGGWRTFEGAQNFCTIRSYLDTMHKQGHNMFEVLRQTFRGRPLSPDSG
jgi:transposase